MVELSSFPVRSVALIQGASRGLGLEFVRQLLASGRFVRVYATARAPRQNPELTTLGEKYPKEPRTLALDVTCEDAVQAAAEKVAFDIDAYICSSTSAVCSPSIFTACSPTTTRRFWRISRLGSVASAIIVSAVGTLTAPPKRRRICSREPLPSKWGVARATCAASHCTREPPTPRSRPLSKDVCLRASFLQPPLPWSVCSASSIR